VVQDQGAEVLETVEPLADAQEPIAEVASTPEAPVVLDQFIEVQETVEGPLADVQEPIAESAEFASTQEAPLVLDQVTESVAVEEPIAEVKEPIAEVAEVVELASTPDGPEFVEQVPKVQGDAIEGQESPAVAE
jgi:hypothetical protein